MEIKQADTMAELGAMRPFLELITDCEIAAFRKEIQAQASKLEYVYWAYREEASILGEKYAGMSTESEFRLGMLLGSGEAAKLMKLAIALRER